MMRRLLTTSLGVPGAVQGLYYLVSGTWPLIAYRSFETITGRKRAPWLVKMVGLITVVVGGVLMTDPAGRTPQAQRLGIGSAIAYALIDFWYAGVRRRISPVYLLDALAEVGLVAAWMRLPRRRRPIDHRSDRAGATASEARPPLVLELRLSWRPAARPMPDEAR